MIRILAYLVYSNTKEEEKENLSIVAAETWEEGVGRAFWYLIL